jgi:glucosamine 6-phosphate synthetase-like amidotransferase/phosphosugar isomerase protein
MCGIAGFCLNPEQHTANPTDIAGSLLLDIEHRGYHATGSAWIDADEKKFKLLKKNIPASRFIPSTGDTLCQGARTAILHTRYATQGSPSNNDNNHPITRGKIALTHNGHIANDTELFKRLNVKRRAQVDSEAVTALIAFTADNYHPTEVLGNIQGSAALAWFDFTDAHNTLHLARVNSSPLWIGQTRGGSILYASTLDAIRNGAWFMFDELDWEHEAREGDYYKIVNGKIMEYSTFNRFAPKMFSLSANWKDVQFDDGVKRITNRSTIKHKETIPF